MNAVSVQPPVGQPKVNRTIIIPALSVLELVKNDKLGELAYRDTCKSPVKDEIETKDAITNEILVINKEVLKRGGKDYTINEVAHIWKKDCRIWLWKNCPELKRNKSVGEKIKLGLLKVKNM